ncbi:MAG: methionine--tRNA ligase, partial [Candidatus Lloydbacteria bacterium]|nr:methionine--tRNA ligase [Candidatus Lloydbacteria bacterium]
DPGHKKAAQAFWKKCKANGDIYKKKYQGLYCVSDEIFLMEKDLVNGKCPHHQNQEPVMIEEENYFFAFSKYQKPLLELYEKHPDFVVPESRFNEIKKFVERGLEDFSISRLKAKMPWGVPVPEDDEHVMYVWFDALVNYISTIGWPDDTGTFEKWWPVVQIAGKDNLGHQAGRFQAMLLSAGLPPSKQIMIHGFITSGGEKMSKSVGNVVNPFDLIERYGTDAVRYYLLREISPFEDGDFTEEKFIEAYNANLANGLGNLVSRVMKMATSYGVRIKTPDDERLIETDFGISHDAGNGMVSFQRSHGCNMVRN